MDMRYNESVANNAPKKERKERELPKQGSYTSKELEKTKQTPWRK
jgi:hypothetical protein